VNLSLRQSVTLVVVPLAAHNVPQTQSAKFCLPLMSRFRICNRGTDSLIGEPAPLIEAAGRVPLDDFAESVRQQLGMVFSIAL
jgi:hypothetical protein